VFNPLDVDQMKLIQYFFFLKQIF